MVNDLFAEASNPTPWYFGELQYFDKEEEGVLKESHLTINGITVNKNTFKDVMEKFGQANVFNFQPYSDVHSENQDQAICYISYKPDDETLLIFQFEKIGSVIYSISLGPKSILKDQVRNCSKSDMVDKNISTLSGIKLGITGNKFTNIVGNKYHKKGQTIYFNFTKKVIMTDKEKKEMEKIFKTTLSANDAYWDCTTGIFAYFDKEKLIWFSLDKSCSN